MTSTLSEHSGFLPATRRIAARDLDQRHPELVPAAQSLAAHLLWVVGLGCGIGLAAVWVINRFLLP